MPLVGALDGRGYLISQSGRCEPADYALNILDYDGSVVAKGTLFAAADLVQASWGEDGAWLQLADGRTLRIIIVGLRPRDGIAPFCSVGPLPPDL